MKKYVRLMIVLGLFTFSQTFAQHHNDKRDKMESLRIAYITEKLALSSDEAEKFWPVYREYNEKQRALKKNLKQSFQNKAATMTDKDAEELYYLELQTRQAETDLFKQYSEKIKAIIGIKKTIQLHVAEVEFRREVIDRIKDKHEHPKDH